jgi:CRISPR-associated Csx2 family protein
MSLARKVFISFLGATVYRECIYEYADTEQKTKVQSSSVFYVQQALAQILTNKTDWDNNSIFYVCTTEKAADYNWARRITQFENKKEGKEFKFDADGLENHLSKICQGKIEKIDIPNGNNEDEIWDIFDSILNVIQEKDIVYLDITNGFRSMPTFATTLLNYAKLQKDINIGGIFYGNFEFAKDNNGIAPILNLTPIKDLQDWTAASKSFLDTGSVAMLEDLITPLDSQLAEDLKNFTLAIATVRGKELCYELPIDDIKSSLNALRSDNIHSRINNILDKIAEQIAPFKSKSTLNGFHAVQWCIKYKMVQGGYTFLQETLKSAAIEAILGQDLNLILNPVARETAATALYGNTEQEIVSRVEKNNIKIPNDIKIKIPNLIAWVASKGLTPHYLKLVKSPALRNDINHAGYNKNASTVKIIINDLSTIFAAIKTCLGI